ncbi:Zn-ribbon domain-containing OB-fold protein [Phenylobacterium aquaticum]|uniref:Zn-ribbon domain-containing OB-fold protein n=1 Tax=Phenylobacterium aquaticum TaxID=1763816 RepID=UPI0026EC8ACC|nr:OB-fold domain-containing protein [Phenylobacterium aquaticum]
MTSRPVAEGLFVQGAEGPRLIGGRRKIDGRFVFPMPQGAEGDGCDPVELKPQGRLWSYTVQRFRPKPPFNGPGDDRSFQPYAVGYVELEGQVIVESRLIIDDFASLAIGMPMALTTEVFRRDADGADILTYAFRPA